MCIISTALDVPKRIFAILYLSIMGLTKLPVVIKIYIARYWSKIADLNLPDLYLALSPRSLASSWAIVWHCLYDPVFFPFLRWPARWVLCPFLKFCLSVLCLAILVQCRLVTDGQTDMTTVPA